MWKNALMTFIVYFCHLVETRRSYDSSYAYLFVRNELTQKERTFCVNYEQWRTKQIAEDVKNAQVLRLGWWGGIVNNTNVCNKGKAPWLNKKAVALNYRLENSNGLCAVPFVSNDTSFKGALQYEVDELASRNTSTAIMLVDKGRKFLSKWADYLFSEFYDPDFNQSTELPTFFMYRSVFFNELLKLSKDGSGSELLLQFYRPPNSHWDISMFVVWIIAVFCVAVGGYWAALRKLYEEETSTKHRMDQVSNIKNQTSKSKSVLNDDRMTSPVNCIFIVIVMVIVVGILMLGFFFRTVMVYIFNIILAIIGTFSVHRCLTALFGSLCKCGQCRVKSCF